MYHYVVELTNVMLRGEPHFPAVATMLNSWFLQMLNGKKVDVLVSHNTPVDVQFLVCEYMRDRKKIPEDITLVLDTCATLKRFSSVAYRKVAPADWHPDYLTKKGKPSMGVKPCAIHALHKLSPPQEFSEVCGEHHDAEADTKAVAVILFDEEQFKSQSLYHCIFKSGKKCCQPIQEVVDAMELKMEEPVLEFETLPSGWVPAPVV